MTLTTHQRMLAHARLSQLEETADRRRKSLDDHQGHCRICGQEHEAKDLFVTGDETHVPPAAKVMLFCLTGFELIRRYTGSAAVYQSFRTQVEAWQGGDKTPGGIILPE